MPKHLLFFTHAFLPENTSAVQRSAPMARYLAEHGFDVHVVASSHAGSVADERVWNVPGPRAQAPGWQVQVARFAQRLAPYNDRLPWIPHALAAAAAIHRRTPVDVVLSTSPPVAAHLAAWRFARRHRLRWVADLQDPIIGNPSRERGWGRPYDRAIERRIFRDAAAVVALTDVVTEQCQQRWPEAAARCHTLWMGYDPAEGIGPMPVPPRQRRVMAHAGFLYQQRHPIALLESLARLMEQRLLDPASFSLQLLGRVDQPERLRAHPAAAALLANGSFELRDEQLPRAEALRFTATADWLLLLDIVSSFGSGYTVPGKLYDYILTGRPILAITDRGSPTERILARSGVAHACLFHGEPAAERDARLLAFLRGPAATAAPSEWFRTTFDARNVAARMAELLRG